MIRDQILTELKRTLDKLGWPSENINLEHPAITEHGDYASNIAMIVFSKQSTVSSLRQYKTPLDLAKTIVDSFPKTDYLEKIEVAEPGFVNLWLKTDYLSKQVSQVLEQKESFGVGDLLKGKKIMVEYGDPNTHKAFHIGHLRNISLGEAVVRLLEAEGAKVIHASYQGDVGMHIAKCLYGLVHNKNLLSQIKILKDIREKVNLIAKAYAEGSQAYETDDIAKKEISLINKQIYSRDPQILDLYETTREWSLDYFEEIYKRLGIRYDKHYFESEMYQTGKENTLKGLEKGIFIESDGAIIFPGDKFGLHKRVFITAEGNPTYEGKDMALGPVQYKDSGGDLIIRVVGPEQAGYFQVVFEAQSQLFPELRGKFIHLPSGWVRLKKGKMSSRTGQVILGEWLLDEVKKRLQESYKMGDEVAEIVAVGAVKYSMLKVSATQEIAFDIDESINLNGDSGPYLQYTYARCQSVSGKASQAGIGEPNQTHLGGVMASPSTSLGIQPATPEVKYVEEELAILRTIYKFPEVVQEAGKNYAPNLICSFLFDLAQKYNLFYDRHPILKAKKQETKKLRLALTAAVGQVIKNGLYLLGIKVVEKM